MSSYTDVPEPTELYTPRACLKGPHASHPSLPVPAKPSNLTRALQPLRTHRPSDDQTTTIQNRATALFNSDLTLSHGRVDTLSHML